MDHRRFLSFSSSSPDANVPFSWVDAVCYDPLVIGGVAVGVMVGTYALLDLAVSLPLLTAGGSGAALLYGLDRMGGGAPEDRINQPGRWAWVRRHERWLGIEALVLAILAGGASLYLRPVTLVGGTLLVSVGALHVLPWETPGRIMEDSVLKPMVIAATWAVGATVLPVLEAGASGNGAVTGLAVYRFLFILPNVMLADWGDRIGDAATGHSPWTGQWTGRQVRVVASSLLLIASGGALFLVVVEGCSLLLLVDVVGPVLMLVAVWTVQPDWSRHRLMLDVLVGWPAVTAATAWLVGG